MEVVLSLVWQVQQFYVDIYHPVQQQLTETQFQLTKMMKHVLLLLKDKHFNFLLQEILQDMESIKQDQVP